MGNIFAMVCFLVMCAVSCAGDAGKAGILINDVKVEKQSVDMNEDVEISVNAEGEDGTDSNLIVLVNGKAGNPSILRFGTSGNKVISVVAKNPLTGEVSRSSVSMEVAKCIHRTLVITAASQSDNSEIYTFQITGPDDLPDNCMYFWYFGDGKYAWTDKKFVTHDYRKRRQTRLVSTFVVKVIAIKNLFNILTGRESITMANYAYWSGQMGSPSVPVIYDRFALKSADSYSAKVEFNNIFDDTVEFEEAEIIVRPCGGGSSQILYTKATDLLDISSIRPRHISKATLRLSTSLIPSSACVASVILTGPWENSKKVKATICLDIPPTQETPGNGNFERVKNQVLIKKLNRAAEILGHGEPITPADIERLEKEGRL